MADYAPLHDVETLKGWIKQAETNPDFARPTQVDRWRESLAFYQDAIQTAPDHTLTKRLEGRRISEQAISTFEIEPNGKGWTYPVPNGGDALRFKSYNGHGPKYKWIPRKPDDAEYYHAPGLLDAIEKAGGVCWFVSGEADVWAMHSAGIQHVFSQYGESSVSQDLAEKLQSAGVMTLYIAPDRDDTGERWARKVAGALEGSGIELDARRLPADLGHKGDIGKAWELSSHQIPFERYLLGLERYTPKAEQPTDKRSPQDLSFREACHRRSVPKGYRMMVANELDVKGYKSDGNSRKNVLCPFHDDHTPSATLHQEKGLYCHTCGTSYTWQDTGVKLGIGTIGEYYAAETARKTKALSTQVREKLCQMKLTGLARLLDALYLAGYEPGDTFTVKQAASACKRFGISQQSIYYTLRKTEETAPEGIYFEKCHTLHVLKRKGDKIQNKYQSRGHPTQVYKLLSPQAIAREFKVTGYQHDDKMPVEALGSNADYRAEVYAAMPRRRPGQYARKTLGKRVGVSGRTTIRYDERTGLNVQERKSKEWIKSADDLPEHRDEIGGNVWLENERGQKFSPTKGGYSRAVRSGDQVYKVVQQANYYSGKREKIFTHPTHSSALEQSGKRNGRGAAKTGPRRTTGSR